MAYEFKKISEVEILNAAPEGATVLGVSDGNVVQMPQPNEIQKLTNVEIFDTVPENATVLGVSNGQVVQMPSGGLGNSNNTDTFLPTFIIDNLTREEMIQMAKDQIKHISFKNYSYDYGYEEIGIVLNYHANHTRRYEEADACDPCAEGTYVSTFTLLAQGISSQNGSTVWSISLYEDEYWELLDILGIGSGE